MFYMSKLSEHALVSCTYIVLSKKRRRMGTTSAAVEVDLQMGRNQDRFVGIHLKVNNSASGQ